jgi:hypothetical protein
VTLNELAERFDELMIDKHAIGFTIGKGKKLYWYITPYSRRTVSYRCLPNEGGGELGWPRFCPPDQMVTVHYQV